MPPTMFAIQSIGSESLTVMAKPESGEVIDKEFAGINAAGINKIVSLLESHESRALGLVEEKLYTEKNTV